MDKPVSVIERVAAISRNPAISYRATNIAEDGIYLVGGGINRHGQGGAN